MLRSVLITLLAGQAAANCLLPAPLGAPCPEGQTCDLFGSCSAGSGGCTALPGTCCADSDCTIAPLTKCMITIGVGACTIDTTSMIPGQCTTAADCTGSYAGFSCFPAGLVSMCVACAGVCDPNILGGLPGVMPGLSFDFSGVFNASVTSIVNGQLFMLDQSLTIATLAFDDATAQAAGALQLAQSVVTTITDLQVMIASAAIDVLAGAQLVINQVVVDAGDALAIALGAAAAAVTEANAQIADAQLAAGSVLRLIGGGRANVQVTTTTGTVEASGGAWLQGHIMSALDIVNNAVRKIYTDNAAGLTIDGAITGAGEIEVTANGWLRTLTTTKISATVNLASPTSQWIVDTGFSGAAAVMIAGALNLTSNFGAQVVFDNVVDCVGSVHITINTDFASAPRTGTVFSFGTAGGTAGCSLVITDSTGATQTIGGTSRRAGSGTFTFANGVASYDLDGAQSAGSMVAPSILVAAFAALFALLR